MSIRKSKVFAVAAAACVLGMMLGGCGSSTSGNATEGSNVITAFDSEPQNGLIPGNTNETGGGRPIDLLFAGLVSFDKDGKAQNEVAESITANDDATQYDIKLKDGWKFTDGTDVTAESFTKAWSYTANAKNAQLCSSFFSTIKGYDALQDTDNLKGDEQLEGLKIVNDHEFTVDLSQSDSAFATKLGYSGFYPMPESFYKDPKAFGESPVSDGPYKFDSWDHDKEIKLVKNPDYKGNRKVNNDGVTFKIYTDANAAYADVQAGNLDVMDTVPSADSKTFESDSSVVPYNKAGSVIQTFTIPSDLEHWKTSTDSLKGNENLKYNKKKAKELWEKANAISPWTSDDKLTFSYNADGGAKPIFEAVVNSVKNTLDIDVTTNPVPTFQEFRNDVTGRKMTGAFRTAWQPDYPSPENYLYQLYSSDAADGNGSNDGDYKNPEFDDLCSKAAAAQTTDEANKLYQQAQEILLNDLPAIPLYYSNANGVAASGVKNFVMNWQNVPVYNEISKS